MITLIIILGLLVVIGIPAAYTFGAKLHLEDGYALGVKETNEKWSARVNQKELEIKCLCGHGPNFHIDGGACEQTVEWTLEGFTDRWSYAKRTQCRCKRYTGPEYSPLVIDMLSLGR